MHCLDGTSFWSGMVGMLANGEADLSTGGLTSMLERSKVMDFTISVIDEPMTLIVRKMEVSFTVGVSIKFQLLVGRTGKI